MSQRSRLYIHTHSLDAQSQNRQTCDCVASCPNHPVPQGVSVLRHWLRRILVKESYQYPGGPVYATGVCSVQNLMRRVQERRCTLKASTASLHFSEEPGLAQAHGWFGGNCHQERGVKTHGPLTQQSSMPLVLSADTGGLPKVCQLKRSVFVSQLSCDKLE